ncbi:tRNA(Ile)-lysidine synthase [Neisseria animaloris]|uniref:tRNA lysidine(34) synthetase TilS n=1 Tax=Neisseria animaloris TaxID=326522 RepID=UPI000A19781D|nr:tRNA lysidine(34) synthetase TilS [Neisseria animaloris]OSI08985.1 tRNA lysidine(34) synthetase TilS [Neisseria animaloris]VEH87022.1 tRNA(Ile)-lysidine synthase [Neisseria animaloris]
MNNSQTKCKHPHANNLLEQVADAWPQHLPPQTVIEVGLSGGLDSVVLLHLLSCMRKRFRFVLKAVHVHHGLNEKADEWAAFCNTLCDRLDIPLRLEKVCVEKNGLGIEAAARKERYRIFSDGRSDIVALAHHRGDQVETFMLAAMRGGGLRALSAMPEWRALNERTQIWRPLLGFTREQLADYADMHDLIYVEDSSNQDSGFLRNWLRNDALPVWRSRLPHLDNHIIGSIASLQNELALLDEIVQQDHQYICATGTFDLQRWRSLSEVRRRQQLWYFAKIHELGVPTAESIADFSRVLNSIQTASAEWQLPDGRIYAYQNRLFVQKNGWEKECAWIGNEQILAGRLKKILPENGFTLRRNLFGICEELLDGQGCIRAANADDVIALTVGHKSVRKILQECKIPSFVRKYWPIVTDSQNKCLAIANIWVSVHYGCQNGVLPVFDKFNCFVLEPKQR